WRAFCERREAAARFRAFLDEQRIPRAAGGAADGRPPAGGTLTEALRRPDVDMDALERLLRDGEGGAAAGDSFAEARRLAGSAAESVQTEIRYAGYLARQRELIARSARFEATPLPPDLDYAKISGLSLEVVEKLDRVRPGNLAQAGRISGVTPAAVACLEIHLHKLGLLRPEKHPERADAARHDRANHHTPIEP
ncbi:MAG: tRNA uridine-5-carboxymethylaminomethyl(34) synthesis enzyme MnmG, partial [Desulfovibrio sp.]|nr:tRNA uridine-5-carboxymethylaminomethyl(34) synthesis enzyme MnmG [Desulfovibrio sp.]